MAGRQFYDWQSTSGADDVLNLVECLEKSDVAWCAIGSVAVNHWVKEHMVIHDVEFVVSGDAILKAVVPLEDAGFQTERLDGAISFHGTSTISIQLLTDDYYKDFPSRSVPADVHGILLRVASLEDTLQGKMRARSNPNRKQSKRIQDLSDIARLVESHPQLWHQLSDELKLQVHMPEKK
jgi:hypothetical protein